VSSKTILLADVPGISRPVLERLRKRWIDSAEQLVAIGATPDGFRALARELEIDPEELTRIVAAARAALPEAAAAEAERRVDTKRYPLGATPPDPAADEPKT
jgi:hypothetical protein